MKEIALHILDIAENSITAGASRVELSIELKEADRELRLEISDNGKGMSEEMLNRTADPFFTSRTTRKVGLGIPLLRQQAEMTGGWVELHSELNRGTQVTASFDAGHPDIQPLGDIAGCWWLLASGNPKTDIVLKCTTEHGNFVMGSAQVREELEIERLAGNELKEQL
ncbi:MAG: ATP-binding protein, partial [Bacteroidales bacterium]|nr:ATP-binding protein [Bacteroidales bacterium]